ncbi:Uncharacterised protein [Cedecea neteri]|uniref:Uncharacterized protein n=1 Tax=Cedecea neteri TaxID=158822 RepID=A0A2X2TAR6_9ENTR|nr:Uncharacterised protein [Cedecea neteri]
MAFFQFGEKSHHFARGGLFLRKRKECFNNFRQSVNTNENDYQFDSFLIY